MLSQATPSLSFKEWGQGVSFLKKAGKSDLPALKTFEKTNHNKIVQVQVLHRAHPDIYHLQ